jgi:hypothetical protein
VPPAAIAVAATALFPRRSRLERLAFDWPTV